MIVIALGEGRAPWLSLAGTVPLIDALVVGDAFVYEREDTLFVVVRQDLCCGKTRSLIWRGSAISDVTRQDVLCSNTLNFSLFLHGFGKELDLVGIS